MTAPVDAVLFDLDDTRCSYRRSSAELLAVAFDHRTVGAPPTVTVKDRGKLEVFKFNEVV